MFPGSHSLRSLRVFAVFAVFALTACNPPYFPMPKHLIVTQERESKQSGLFIHLLPFSNNQVTVNSVVFEFHYLTAKVAAQTVSINIPVNSNSPLNLPYEGDYEVTIRRAGFKRTSFPLRFQKSHRVIVEVALDFDPGLAFELKPEFP